MGPPTDDEVRAEFLWLNDPFASRGHALISLGVVAVFPLMGLALPSDDGDPAVFRALPVWGAPLAVLAVLLCSAWARRLARRGDRAAHLRYVRLASRLYATAAPVSLVGALLGLSLQGLQMANRISFGEPAVAWRDLALVAVIEWWILCYVLARRVLAPRLRKVAAWGAPVGAPSPGEAPGRGPPPPP